jgi:hypothetical protein
MDKDTRPDSCFVIHPTIPAQVVKIRRGVLGFWPIKRLATSEEAATMARTLNRADDLRLTPAMAEAMLVGSMFGWDVPGAYPEAYQGKLNVSGVMHPEAERD